ncbi:ferritin-like domain-containing protein [Candidatus Woesearchaeota archaeon]|jgi:rubrerythrin|nr:ferritin-like domain-containing protein [Candidatus Woesearchaeota archaeon]MBT4114606.1 ferritin-like domain-containing protein [Candidatus Woesearchaeota archaeon]MBT4248487.1 ferritin-like domain-containing protein [Candidatus Woesearchaeota archaeon]
MKDIEILKKVAAQELAAETRYAEQVSKLCDGKVKEVIAELKDEEQRHKRECAVIIKFHESGFDASSYDEAVDMELNSLQCVNMPDMIAFLELDVEKELEAKKLYEGYARDAKDEKIANMLINFAEDEASHVEKIHALLSELQG